MKHLSSKTVAKFTLCLVCTFLIGRGATDYSESEKEWTETAMKPGRMQPWFMYPIRCIRIDDPKHIMDSPESGMATFFHNARMLPYLFK